MATSRISRRVVVFVAAMAATVASIGNAPAVQSTQVPRRHRPPVLVAAGDIASDGNAKFATAARVAAIDPRAVVALGDLVYDDSSLDAFRALWTPSWGRFDDIVWPVPGNHEYRVADAGGYREYFGIEGRTWWARRVGRWVVIGLDSQRADSQRQLAFLRRRLAANDGHPTVVAWHHARFSSGIHDGNTAIEPLWRVAARDRDVRIALWGHDHHYEHLAIPVAGRSTKVHAFVVGTGGSPLRGLTSAPTPYTRDRIDDQHGVLRLRLGKERWRWAFVRTDGLIADRGRRRLVRGD